MKGRGTHWSLQCLHGASAKSGPSTLGAFTSFRARKFSASPTSSIIVHTCSEIRGEQKGTTVALGPDPLTG